MTRIEELERELELAKELLTVYKAIAGTMNSYPPDGDSRKWEPYRYHYPWWPQVFCETKEGV